MSATPRRLPERSSLRLLSPTPRRWSSRTAPWRVAFVAALGLAELAWLRAHHTTDSLAVGDGAWWAAILRSARFHLPFGLAVLGGVLLIGWEELRDEWRARLDRLAPVRRPWRAACTHLGAVLLLDALTLRLLEEPDRAGAVGSLLFVCWLVSAAAVALSLAALATPLGSAWQMACLLRRPLALGTLVGAGAFGLARWLLAGSLWHPLAVATLRLARPMVGAFAGDVVYDESQLVVGTTEFAVRITRWCSGYEGAGLYLVFFASFLSLQRRRFRFPAALLLLPVGACLVWLANALRVAALILVGSRWSPELAAGGFHSYAGWLLFTCVALGTLVWSLRSPFFAHQEPAALRALDALDALGEARPVNHTAVYLAPLLAWTAGALALGTVLVEPEAWYSLRFVPAGLVLWRYRRQLPSLAPSGPLAGPALGLLAALAWVAVGAFTRAPGSGAETGAALATPAGLGGASLHGWWAARVLGAALVVPLLEELAFRGYLLRRLAARDFERLERPVPALLPVLASSMLFGALHADWIAGTLAGLVFAAAYLRRGRLGDAVLAHAVANAALLAAAALLGAPWIYG